MSLSKLEHWKASVEIDYLALYIKTWFAFLTSVKQIHPDIQSTIGDGPILKHYIENLALPNNYDSDIKKFIKESFDVGQRIIKRDLPSSFFGKFYLINDNYSFDLPHTNHIQFKIQYRKQLSGKHKPNLYITFKSTQEQFHNKFKVYFFAFNISISDIIENNIYTNKDSLVTYIIGELRKKGIIHIEAIPNLQESGINQRKAYLETILTLISQQWRPHFSVNEIFKPLPVPGFPEGYDENSHKLVVLRWFVRFSYDLRNILFHHIIDPFDEEWLKLFKSTFFALNEIVNHNINTIRQRQINANPNQI